MQAASDETTDNRVVWTCCKNNDGELGPRSAWERRSGLFALVHDFDWETFDAPEKDKRELIAVSIPWLPLVCRDNQRHRLACDGRLDARLLEKFQPPSPVSRFQHR